MEKAKVKLNEKDRKRLVELYSAAQNTPVITWGCGQTDMATQAWERVREFMDSLGKKYGFDTGTIKGIDPKTGEVLE